MTLLYDLSWMFDFYISERSTTPMKNNVAIKNKDFRSYANYHAIEPELHIRKDMFTFWPMYRVSHNNHPKTIGQCS